MNTHARNAMVRAIVENWVASEEDCLGSLVTDENFIELYARVEALSTAGSSITWKAAVRKWCETITYAHKTFCDMNDLPYMSGIRHSELTRETGMDYARRIKWAVMYGATYVSNI